MLFTEHKIISIQSLFSLSQLSQQLRCHSSCFPTKIFFFPVLPHSVSPTWLCSALATRPLPHIWMMTSFYSPITCFYGLFSPCHCHTDCSNMYFIWSRTFKNCILFKLSSFSRYHNLTRFTFPIYCSLLPQQMPWEAVIQACVLNLTQAHNVYSYLFWKLLQLKSSSSLSTTVNTCIT